jgi:hypothetical protein
LISIGRGKFLDGGLLWRRADDETRPVIVVSSSYSLRDREQVNALGVGRYLRMLKEADVLAERQTGNILQLPQHRVRSI